MKKLLLILLLFVFAQRVKAQTFDEWFKQSKTQKKYLVQQIAALQIYIGYMQKGYSIAKKGLSTIGTVQKEELNLHSIFFNSLKSINPNIRHYATIADIISLQLTIVRVSRHINALAQNNSAFNAAEISYISRVYNRLLLDCAASTDELIAVTKDNQLEMKDNERIRRINKIYLEMQDKYSFAQSFANQASVLAAARAKEKNNITTSRVLIGLP